jgi:hypothetical protein
MLGFGLPYKEVEHQSSIVHWGQGKLNLGAQWGGKRQSVCGSVKRRPGS